MSLLLFAIGFFLAGFLIIILLLIIYYQKLNRKKRMLVQKIKKLIKMKNSIDCFRKIIPRKNASHKRQLNKMLIIHKKEKVLLSKLLKKDKSVIIR